MQMLCNSHGSVSTNPDDFFEKAAIPVRKWIEQKDGDYPYLGKEKEDFKKLSEKMKIFHQAEDLYVKISGGKEVLRIEPYVQINYEPSDDGCGSITLWFFFKEDNNGTTYKIKHEWKEF